MIDHLSSLVNINTLQILEKIDEKPISLNEISKQFEEQIEKHLQPGSVGYFKQFLKPLPEDQIKSWLSHQVYLSLGFFLGACASVISSTCH